MKIRIKFPPQAIDFIERLEGFDPLALYHIVGDIRKPHEWGRMRYGDKIIYFDCISETTNDWTSVKDEKPNNYMSVMVTNSKGWMRMQRATYHKNEDVFVLYNPQSTAIYTLDVTHWFEIPELPKEKRNDDPC